MQPAIDLAAKGIIVSDDFAYALGVRRDRLSRDPAAAKALYKANGDSYLAGERFVQKDLAWSLREISKGGADAFYRGHRMALSAVSNTYTLGSSFGAHLMVADTQSVMCTNGRFFGGANTRRPDAAAVGIN